jgi:hypothetical protein
VVNDERVSSACLIQRNKEDPLLVAQKRKHKFYIGMLNQVRRHGLYSGHYSRVFIAPKNAKNTETKHWSGTVPILLLALLALMTSPYSALVFCRVQTPDVSYLKCQSTTWPHQPFGIEVRSAFQ